MAAPLVSALAYFLTPRLMGAAADTAMRARVDSLLQESRAQGFSPEDTHARVASDPYLNALALVPRQSGAESAFDALRNLYNGNPYGMSRSDIPPPGVDVSGPDARTIDQILSGQGFDTGAPAQAYVTRDGQFLTPMDDFLRYGGRDDDAGRYFYRTQESYGQTDQPAPEVTFNDPLSDFLRYGGRDADNYEVKPGSGGGASGGLAALIRGMHAKR